MLALPGAAFPGSSTGSITVSSSFPPVCLSLCAVTVSLYPKPLHISQCPCCVPRPCPTINSVLVCDPCPCVCPPSQALFLSVLCPCVHAVFFCVSPVHVCPCVHVVSHVPVCPSVHAVYLSMSRVPVSCSSVCPLLLLSGPVSPCPCVRPLPAQVPVSSRLCPVPRCARPYVPVPGSLLNSQGEREGGGRGGVSSRRYLGRR